MGPPGGGPSRPAPSLVGIERGEVVADVVLDRDRDVRAVERGERVVVELAVDARVRDVRAVVRSLALLAALLGLAIAARARDVRRVTRPAEAVERGEHGAEVAAELAGAVRVHRSAWRAAGRAA